MSILTLGDAAFTVEFPELEGAFGARYVRQLQQRVQKEIDRGQLPGVVDLISATRSLTVCIDPASLNLSRVRDAVFELAQAPFENIQDAEQIWTLPVCYEAEYAKDLDDIAERSGLSTEEVIRLHTSRVYDILLIGFLPGFPFMSEVSEVLRFPRRKSPRMRVPAGSVAIANKQTAIYPWESPGGWHLIGTCPVPLFNSSWESPGLLTPGEQVSFEAITQKEFELLKKEFSNGCIRPTQYLNQRL